MTKRLKRLFDISAPARLGVEIGLADLIQIASPEFTQDEVFEILRAENRERVSLAEGYRGKIVAFDFYNLACVDV